MKAGASFLTRSKDGLSYQLGEMIVFLVSSQKFSILTNGFSYGIETVNTLFLALYFRQDDSESRDRQQCSTTSWKSSAFYLIKACIFLQF